MGIIGQPGPPDPEYKEPPLFDINPIPWLIWVGVPTAMGIAVWWIFGGWND